MSQSLALLHKQELVIDTTTTTLADKEIPQTPRSIKAHNFAEFDIEPP